MQEFVTLHPVVARLAAMDGVTHLVAIRGQVLVHADHVPRGIYVVVRGAVELTGPDGTLEQVSTDKVAGPFVLPVPIEFDDPALWTVRAMCRSDVLYVPRSSVLLDPDMSALLAELALPAVSLLTAPAPPK